jgi:hypothetical protein
MINDQAAIAASCVDWRRQQQGLASSRPSSTLSAQPSINKSQSSKLEAYNLHGSHAMNSGCGERLASLIRQAMSYVFTTRQQPPQSSLVDRGLTSR